MSPSVLYLTHEPPLPAVSGTRVRASSLMRELGRRGWAVRLFSLAPGGSPPREELAALEELAPGAVVEPFTPPPALHRARLAAQVATGRAFQRRMFWSSRAAARLRRLLAEEPPDAIVAGQLYMHPYVPAEWHGREVLDCYNVELRRVESMADALWPRPRGVAARLQRRPVARYEAAAVRAAARVLAVSELEREHFERLAPGRVTTVANGVDCAALRPRDGVPAEPHVLFLGSLDYSANADGALHLLDDVLPLVERRDVAVSVVGGGPPPAVHAAARRAAADVEVTGRVPDTAPWFARSRLLAVPLRFGGGTRLKILEALARGVPVVTTPLGCEGLGLEHGRDAIVAGTPRELARWIDRLLADDDLCVALAREGRRTAERRYDWPVVGEALEAAVREVVTSNDCISPRSRRGR